MADPADWALVARYTFVHEADFAAATLESAGIPSLLAGREPGIWGLAFAGPTARGVGLLVPRERVEEAREVLEPGDDVEDV